MERNIKCEEQTHYRHKLSGCAPKRKRDIYTPWRDLAKSSGGTQTRLYSAGKPWLIDAQNPKVLQKEASVPCAGVQRGEKGVSGVAYN